MGQRTPTYSTNPDDYEYDPALYHLREIPGVGTYQFANEESEEEIQKRSDKISLEADLQYQNLHRDAPLIAAYKRYYNRKEGTAFTGTDEEAVDNFMSDFAYIDNNLTFGLGKVLIDQTSLSDQDKFDVGLLYDRYERTDATGEGSRPFLDQLKDVSGALLTDPVNAIGVFTGGIGFLARGAVGKVAGQVAKETMLTTFRNSVAGRMGTTLAQNPIKSAALSGAGWAATYDLEKQGLEIGSGMQKIRHNITGESESFDYDELILTTVTGGAFGGLVGVGVSGLSKFFSKGSYSNILGKDRTNSTTQELRAEVVALDTEFSIEGNPIVIPKTKIDDVHAQYNKTQLEIDAETVKAGQTGVRAKETPEQEYPLSWANENGDETNVTVSNIITSPATETAPKVTRVILKDADGVEYNVVPNEGGGILNPKRQFKSDEDLRNFLDGEDIKKLESPIGVMQKANSFLKRNLTSHFGLGTESAERIRDGERMLSSSGEKINILTDRFEKAWEKQYGSSFEVAAIPGMTTREIHKVFIKALTTGSEEAKTDLVIQGVIPEGSEISKVIKEWRDIISETSNELLESGALSEYRLDTNGNQMLDEAGKPIKNSFVTTLKRRKAEQTYLHTMYKIYEDPDYAEKSIKERLTQKDYDEVKKSIMDRGFDETSAQNIIEDIGTKSKNRNLGDVGSLAKKQGLNNEQVKILLGEITDPRKLFAASVFKTKKILEDYKLKRDLVAIGLRRSTTKRPMMARSSIGNTWNRIEAGKRSMSLDDTQLDRMWNNELEGIKNQEPAGFLKNPFDSIFVDPEYKKYFDAMSTVYDTNIGPLQRVMAGATFSFNLSHTVLSPTTHMRNFGGGSLQNLYNAILPWGSRAWRKAVSSEGNLRDSPTYSVFRRTVPLFNKFKQNKELGVEDVSTITRLIELGILHNGMRAGIFREAYNIATKGNANPVKQLEAKLLSLAEKDTSVVKRGSTIVSKTIDKTAEIYEMSDNINKISAFESEFAWLYKDFGKGDNTDVFIKLADSLGVFDAKQRLASAVDPQKMLVGLIEEATAKKVNMFTPTYSQLAGVSRSFRQFPLGNFVAFPMEITRNYANSWRLAALELRTSSPGMRVRGSLRAAALAGATGITVGGIGGLSATINGITDTEREALESKELASDFEFGTGLFYMGSIKDGTLKSIPLGYTDPFSYLSTIARVAMHSFSQNQEDSVLNSRLLEASWEAFKVAMEPYVLPSVGPSALLKTYSELSNAWESDEGINQEAILRSLNTAFTPTVVKDIAKFIPSENNVTKWGTEVDPKWHTAIALATGMKPQNIDINTKVGFALSDADRQKDANSRKFNAYIDNAKNWSGNYRENIIEQYKEYLNEEKEIARKVKRIFKSGLTLGVDRRNLLDLASSISKSVEATKAGSGKYRAGLPRKYVNSIWGNRYPIFYLSKDARRKIANSMRSRGISLDEDNLLQDLNKIAYDLNKDMGD
jgi:hypothetical protein